VTKVLVYPADSAGCGHFRLIWPGSYAPAESGVDVTVLGPRDRDLMLKMDGDRVADVLNVRADVYVFQRVTHRNIMQAIPILRSKGVAVVVDVDDDLSSIHPRNPAHDAYHPKRGQGAHSWANLKQACRDATLVTVSTPALLEVYAAHGRGRVLYNYLPDHYYGVPHEDSDVIGWPAALQSHPDDPSAVGASIARVVADSGAFRVVGSPLGVGAAFGLSQDPPGLSRSVDVLGWPGAVTELGIGIAPLADTRFNRCKSWLKPLEMSALGVPWVASPSVEYARLNRMGAGLLAHSNRTWYRSLDLLRRDWEFRSELAGRGYEVAQQLRIRDHAWMWLEAWTDALRLQHASQTAGATPTIAARSL
jgi:hypothetical protein